MKRDLMEEFEDQDLQPMHMSEEERRRVLENTLGKIAAAGAPAETAPVQPKKKRLRRIPRFAALLAAVIAAFALTAGAAHVFHMSVSLRAWFGDSATPELIESLGVAGWPIEQSQTVDGYTVTVQGVIGDKHTSYLVFDVEAPEGVTLNNKWGYGFREWGLSGENPAGAFGASYWELPDDDPSDNRISFVYAQQNEDNLIGAKVRFALSGFVKYVDESEQDTTTADEWPNEKLLAEGGWDFEFEFGYTDTSIGVPVKQRCEFRGADLQHISISPLSVRLEYQRGLLSPFTDQEEQENISKVPEIVLHFADGSTIATADEQVGGAFSELWTVTVTKSYHKLIDLDALTDVEIDGVLFPVNRP